MCPFHPPGIVIHLKSLKSQEKDGTILTILVAQYGITKEWQYSFLSQTL